MEWWAADLIKITLLDKIFLFLSDYALRTGFFNRFLVQTGLLRDGKSLSVCKGEYKIEGPANPHVIQCDISRTAKYIHLSVRGSKVALQEVKVTGTPVQGMGTCLFIARQ